MRRSPKVHSGKAPQAPHVNYHNGRYRWLSDRKLAGYLAPIPVPHSLSSGVRCTQEYNVHRIQPSARAFFDSGAKALPGSTPKPHGLTALDLCCSQG